MKPNYRKIVQAITYFANSEEDKTISKLVMLKLVYLADRYHMRKYGTMITNDEYWAMAYGPVASKTKNVAERNRLLPVDVAEYAARYFTCKPDHQIEANLSPDCDELGVTEVEALDVALSVYQNNRSIVKFTHKFPEWKKHELALMAGSRCKKMPLTDFFDDCKGDYCKMSRDHVLMARDIFEEDCKINSLLQ